MSAVLNAHTNTKIVIETAGFQHEDEVHTFYQTQQKKLGPFAYFLKGKSAADIAALLKKGAVYLARAGENGPLAGMAAITPTMFNAAGKISAFGPTLHHAFATAACAEINSLVIAPEQARMGIATALLGSCETWAKGRKINHLFARVVSGAEKGGDYLPGNTTARATFEGKGYRYIGDTKRNTDPQVDLWVMGKTL